MRDDPHPEATAELVVTAEGTDTGGAADAELDPLATALEDAGAEVLERLRFGAIRVECPETVVAEICSLDGIESIETGATRELAGGDAGEDL